MAGRYNRLDQDSLVRVAASESEHGRFAQPTTTMQRRILVVSPQRQEWLSKRNCALTPRQLAVFFGGLGLFSMAVATAWALQGAWVVVPFAGIEIAALGVAYVLYGRHAADFDRVVFEPGKVWAEAACGPVVRRFECARMAARVEYGGNGRRGLIRLVGRGHAIEVGRFLLDEDRAALAKELRATLAAS